MSKFLVFKILVTLCDLEFVKVHISGPSSDICKQLHHNIIVAVNAIVLVLVLITKVALRVKSYLMLKTAMLEKCSLGSYAATCRVASACTLPGTFRDDITALR